MGGGEGGWSWRAIHENLPGPGLTPLGEAEVAAIRAEYPDAPAHYLDFLRHVGWGSLGGGFMIYSGPCKASDFFGANPPAALAGIVFFGDDLAGWMAGFDARDGWRLVGVDSRSCEPSPQAAETLAAFLAERLADEAI